MSSEASSSSGAACPERRAHARRTVDLLANRFVDGQPRLLRVVDLSMTGLRAVPVGAGAPQSKFGGLQFQLPGIEEVLTASSEAVEGGEGGALRLRFTFLPEHTRRSLAQFVAMPGTRRTSLARTRR